MPDPEILGVLRSIDATLKELLALSKQRRALGGNGAASHGKPVASERELDAQYGNPEVKTDPRDWTGPSCKGRLMSQCPPEFLDLLSEFLEWAAGKDEEKGEMTSGGKPKAEFRRKDAARARGWAARLRAGYKPTTTSTATAAGAAGWGKGEEW